MKTYEINQRAYERNAERHIRTIRGWARMKPPVVTDAAIAARNASMQDVARDIVTRIDAVRDDVRAMSALYREWFAVMQTAPEIDARRNLIPIAINALAALSLAKGVRLS
jgi:hypothetical protein